jgi:hypothetical protein
MLRADLRGWRARQYRPPSDVFALRNLWWIAGTAGAAAGSIWN